MVAPKYLPHVESMLATPGIYFLHDPAHPDKMVPIFSTGGKLFSMTVDEQLDPHGFYIGTDLEGPIQCRADKEKAQKMKEQLMDREFLKEAADGVRDRLPDGYGFILLAFGFDGEGDKRLLYISNAKREDVINAMKAWLLKCGAAEDWMKHIK